MPKTNTSTANKTKSADKKDAEAVAEFLRNLDHPLKDEILAVRKIISQANSNLTEHIKWNAPSFCFAGEDRITFNLHNKSFIRLIFHCGAKKTRLEDRLIQDDSGFLTWASSDRAIAIFTNMEDVKSKENQLLATVNKWLAASC